MHVLVAIEASAKRQLRRRVVLRDRGTRHRVDRVKLGRAGYPAGRIDVGDRSARKAGRAIHIARMGRSVAVAFLTEEGRPGSQQRRIGRAVRRVTVHAIVHRRRMLPKERAPLLGVAGPAGFVGRVLDEQLGAIRAMRIVAVGADHLAHGDRVGRNALDFGALRLVAGEADARLGVLRQNRVPRRMNRMAVRASDIATLMLAAHPVGTGKDLGVVTGQAGRASLLDGGHVLRLGCKHDIGMDATRVRLMAGAFAVT